MAIERVIERHFKDGIEDISQRKTAVISDDQLAEEKADLSMAQLREALKAGAAIVVSQPPVGAFKIINLYRDTSGKVQQTVDLMPVE